MSLFEQESVFLFFIAFVRLFSTVCLQMCPQIACIRGCIITQIAFVWLFPAVRFQMSPENICIFGWKFTLVALVWRHILVILCRAISSIDIVFRQPKTLKVFIHNFYWRDICDLTSPLLPGYWLLSFDWNLRMMMKITSFHTKEK